MISHANKWCEYCFFFPFLHLNYHQCCQSIEDEDPKTEHQVWRSVPKLTRPYTSSSIQPTTTDCSDTYSTFRLMAFCAAFNPYTWKERLISSNTSDTSDSDSSSIRRSKNKNKENSKRQAQSQQTQTIVESVRCTKKDIACRFLTGAQIFYLSVPLAIQMNVQSGPRNSKQKWSECLWGRTLTWLLPSNVIRTILKIFFWYSDLLK